MAKYDKSKLEVAERLADMLAELEMGTEETDAELRKAGLDPDTIPFETMLGVAKRLSERLKEAREENEKFQSWINDLQSGMYINCVYCGHQYGPADKVPSTMADALKRHIEKCHKHPMSHLKKENKRLLEVAKKARCLYPHIAPGCTFLPMEGISNHTDLCKEARVLVNEIEEKDEKEKK